MQDERKHLTVREVEKLMAATQGGRNAARDHCLLLLMFRHGLRVSDPTLAWTWLVRSLRAHLEPTVASARFWPG